MTPLAMHASDQFNALIHSLGQRWDIHVAMPVLGFTVRFDVSRNSVAMLRLDHEENRVVLGVECQLPGQHSSALNAHEMQIFMLRRNFASRFGSQTRYGWLGTSGKIAAFQSIPLADADVENISANLAAISVRLNAMTDVAALFSLPQNTVPAEADNRNSRHV